MTPAHIVEIVTPKRVRLDGLWFGPTKPKRVILWVHGLNSTLFRNLHFVESFTDKETALLIFNTRGHDTISRFRTTNEKTKPRTGGGGHEVFTECADDIQGAVNFAQQKGVHEIYVGGISTGCQKSVYWAAKTKNAKKVKGIILLAPISDYASDAAKAGVAHIAKTRRIAERLIKQGKKHELLPAGLWNWPLDAQRFVSLYSGEGAEEVFPYWNEKHRSRTYTSVKLPVLALFAEEDEYAERPAENMIEWFAKNTGSRYFRAGIVPKVGHSFKGGERRVAQLVRRWISAL